MNTWIISPNWVAWVLLAIASMSLLGLVIYFWSRPNQRHNHISVVSWVALVLAMVSVVCAFTRSPQNSDATNMITVLGILITLLVGWQIFSLININRIEERIRETNNNFHAILGELCGDISASQAGIDTMAHVALLFTIHSLIHYSHIGDYEQCEREIDALKADLRIFSTNDAGLRAMYHRMTGRIENSNRISNFGRLIDIIDTLFTHTEQTSTTPSN